MVDPANTPLGRMLLDEITPVVMVLHTPMVEEACLKNGLTLVQMLSPFCSFNNIDVPVRTASDQPYRLQRFKLRLVYASDVRQPNWEVSKERLKQVITEAGEIDLSELCSDPTQNDGSLTASESEVVPLWFQFFNKELNHTASFSDHEAFDHPVACLLVVSSNDDYPINRFVDLFNTNKLPSLLNDGAMDPKILKQYLLVHDNQDGSSEKASKTLTEMKSTFGSNDCRLLCINSSQDGVVEHQDNPWASCRADASCGQQLGCFINDNDLDEIKALIHDLSSKHIIPFMEQKIRWLNQQVSATRKGFRNQIKNLWWRKGKEEMAESPTGPTYTFSSIEYQIRVLGDFAFMLRDYELALSNYRLISTDYKLDKAWKQYAGVQEMMGLTYFMLDQSRKEAEYCMENAFTTYLKIGSSSQQNATRCGLWWVEMLKARDQYREAAAVYFRICGEDPLHSAVMLEQASYCYLLSKPPLLRKYGFHLVLSGDRYKRSDQIKHAIRAYRNAISIFKGTTWSHIKDHVYFHIGQWYASLEIYDTAVKHMLEVLACSHQSKATQELFLTDFLQVVQKTGKTYEVLKLQLPKINFSSLKVVFEDHRTFASPAAAGVKESLWRSLEEDMIPSFSSARSNWLELQSKLTSKMHKESNICVAGESVMVDIEFKNPLQIPVSISSVSLICTLSSRSDEIESDANRTNNQLHSDAEPIGLTNRDVSSDSTLAFSEVDFSLGGNETIVVQLMVTPKVEGILRICGVRWKLSGSVVGFYNFESDQGRKKILKGRQKPKQTPSDNLKLIVVKNLPKLEGLIHSLPKIAYAGDLQHLVLELRNQSEIAVKNLKLKISHPRFMIIGNQENLNVEFPACMEKTERRAVQASPSTSHALFLFPEDTSVKRGTPLLWSLWFRAAVPGHISLFMTLYYEIEDASSMIRYRTLRMHCNLQVLPSLDVSFQINPCPSKLQQFLVRMDVVNRTSSEVFQVHQLSSVGCQWELSLLQPLDTIFPSGALLSGQALSCFFTLKNSEKTLCSGDKRSSSSPLQGSDLRLCPEGSDIKVFDTSISPLADFHHFERLHQEMSEQGDKHTVDFILISRLLKNNTDPVISETRLFSHHVCHCSTSTASPISWLLNGPRILYHDFSASFCEIKLNMLIYNSSNVVLSTRIETIDSANGNGQSSREAGWQGLSPTQDTKVPTDVHGAQTGKSIPLENVPLFIWTGSSSPRVRLEPMSETEIPLQISVFSPGTFDLSSYILHWTLLPGNGDWSVEGSKPSSGTCRGYPYYLTVLQST